MADVKISALPAATTPLAGTEVLPIVQSSTTKKVAISDVTAGRAISANSLTLTTPLAVASGGTGISTTGAGTFVVSATANTISATATPTLGVQQTTQGTLTLANTAAGAWPVTLQSSNSATAAWTMTLPTAPAAANGYILTSTTGGVTSWTSPTALGIDLDVGTTAITGGTTTRVLYNNAGVLGEYAVTGTGSVVLGTTPTFTTSALFPAGTVSAPGISVSGDTNTGVYFPAADNVAIATGGVAALTADSSQNVSVTNTLVMGSSFKRNRIINGDMRVDQRGVGTAGVSTSSATAIVYTLDRWFYFVGAASKFTIKNTPSTTENDFLVRLAAGFTNYVAFTSTSAYTPGINEEFTFQQRIEGFNTADFAWGTAGAKTVTLSFWVNSSIAGTFGGVLNATGDPTYPFTYVIAAGDVNKWVQRSVVVPGPTTGTFATNNTSGISLIFSLGAGSGKSAAAGSWANTSASSASGATALVATNGATLFLTGVQLEVGSVATPYERQIYSDQLAQCQRYYEVTDYFSGVCTTAGTVAGGETTFKATKRSAPTISVSGAITITDGYTASYTQSAAQITTQTATVNSVFVFMGNFSGLTLGRAYWINTTSSASVIQLSSEL